MQLSLQQICQWAGGELFDDDANSSNSDAHLGWVSGYSIDSRTVQPGDLFFAIRGECFDGHDFVETALQAGAHAAVVARGRLEHDDNAVVRGRLVVVEDPLAAMQRLAASVRQHWGHRVIGITGSAGKTTTKEAVSQVLACRFRVHKSIGNLNNHYGLPLQLLRLQPEHEVAVMEMGMSHAGEIAALCRIAAPDWGVVTNVGMAHAENFSDGQAGIARAKHELIASLPDNGTAILNGDDPYVQQFGRGFPGSKMHFGLGSKADVRAESIVAMGAEGMQFIAAFGGQHAPVRLGLMGEHNVRNALAAIAVGVASGIPFEECADALRALQPQDKRGQMLQICGAAVINDAYNSNPQALNAMVDALLAVPAQRRIVVAGEMLELGPGSSRMHYECGQYMARRGIDVVLGVRGEAQSIVDGAKAGATAIFLPTPEEAGTWLHENLRSGDAVLLKASRGVRLERALEALQPQYIRAAE